MSRFEKLCLACDSPSVLSDAQQRVYDKVKSGPRKSVPLPFKVWLHSPEMLDRFEALGLFLRNGISLSPAHVELAILITARFWTAQYVWDMHEPLAVEAGVDPLAIRAIASRQPPPFVRKDECALYTFCRTLFETGKVDDPIYEDLRGFIGEQGIVELLGVLGYYSTLAFTVNVAQVPVTPRLFAGPAGGRTGKDTNDDRASI